LGHQVIFGPQSLFPPRDQPNSIPPRRARWSHCAWDRHVSFLAHMFASAEPLHRGTRSSAFTRALLIVLPLQCGPTCHLAAASTTRAPCADLSLASRGLGHVPDSEDSGDKSRARPRPPLLQPSCALPSLIQSAVVPRERGWCGPPPVKLVTGGRLSLARWPGASSHSPLSACGHPGRLRGRASG
jgi:hypothetical protein